MKEQINQLVSEIENDLINWRRHFHRNPELSSKEYKTAAFVADKLREFGLEDITETYAYTTGVTAFIDAKSNETIALRADMDALPIHEKNETEYSSCVSGVMHACGHDAHTAILLGTAYILNKMKNDLKVNIRLIFQPCEEIIDKNDGAPALIKGGILENPKVKAIFALHVYPDLPVGQVGTREGHFMASADIFKIKINGKSSHASRPHKSIDPVVISAQVINSINHIVSRKVDPLHPAVVTIGKINGGVADNIIPDEVIMSGTVRTLSIELRDEIPKWMESTLDGVTKGYGGSYEFEYNHGTPPLINDKNCTRYVFESLKDILGENQVVNLNVPSMGAEDFGEYLMEVPGTFIRLGIRNESKKIISGLHSSTFDLDEKCLSVGVKTMSYLALNSQNLET